MEEIDERLAFKISKMISSVGEQGLKGLGKTRKVYREEICELLKRGREYRLDPDIKFLPKGEIKRRLTPAEAYGLD